MWNIQSKYQDPHFYKILSQELFSLVETESNLIANLANISSWIFHSFPNLNWCGFYLWHDSDQELVLGPFQGLPACIRIKPTKGVCGYAFTNKKTTNVPDVSNFPGHIFCDTNTKSELVIPLLKDGQIFGVLDLDSDQLNNFSENDSENLTLIINKISNKIF